MARAAKPKYVGMFEEELNNFVQEIKELKSISLKGGEKWLLQK